MARKRPPNKSGIFLGGVGGSIGPNGEGLGTEKLAKRIGAERKKQAALALKKTQQKPSGFFESLAEDIGLEDFYERDVIPVMGRVFADTYRDAKETYGLSLAAPMVGTARDIAGGLDKQEEFDEGFDYAAEATRAGAGIVKTKGWEPAKKFVAPAIDKGTKVAGKGIDAFADAVKRTDDEIESAVPQYGILKNWADRNAVEPVKDVAAEAITKVVGQPVNMRISAADDVDRGYIYSSNDITQRGTERASEATPAMRERWIRMATGQYSHPAWEGYESPFSIDQLRTMSDYELVNAAYGTHTNSIASIFEAAKNDFKKIAAMPAALNVFSEQILDAEKRGDFRGLGNMAEFLARQAASVFVAVNNASLYAATGGQMGDYKPLVRALKTEPLLTTLDTAATASIYGKGATIALKTGGGITKAGALASRVPGAAQAGSAIARVAERGAEATRFIPDETRVGLSDAARPPVREVDLSDADRARLDGAAEGLRRRNFVIGGEERVSPLSPFQPAEAPRGLVGTEVDVNIPVIGPLFRGAASLGRGARKIADTDVVEVRDPAFREIQGVDGINIGADRTFRPSKSFFSKSASLLRKRLYEGTNPVSRAIYKRGEKADAASERAIVTAIVEQLGTERAAPIVNAFTTIYKEDPDVAARVVWELSGPESFTVPEGVGGGTVALTPGGYADELESVLAGRLWVKRINDRNEQFRFGDESPGAEWSRVVPFDSRSPDGGDVIRLSNEDTASLKAQILMMRKLDNLPEEKVQQARNFIEGSYREQFGENIGRRFTGRKSPDESLGSIVEGQEFGEQGSVPMLSALGATMDARVADMPAGLESRLQGRLGIGAPTKITRRAKGMAAVARLQDATIARLMPLVGDRFRAAVEDVLAEETAARKADLDAAQGRVDVVRAAEERLAENEKALEEMRAELQAAGVDFSALPPMTPEDVAVLYYQNRNGWEELVQQSGENVNTSTLNIFATPSESLLVERVGDATGSNTDFPSGVWRDNEGIERYVKAYADDRQAIHEMVANEIYQRLGIPVPRATLSVYTDPETGAKRLIIATEMIDGVPLELAPDTAEDVLRAFVADAWLGNWDAVGATVDNVLQGADGAIYRIDQGGALRYRGMGERKTDEQAFDAPLSDFFDKNPSYRQVLDEVGLASADDMGDLGQQLKIIEALLQRYEDDGPNPVAGLVKDIRESILSDMNSLKVVTDEFDGFLIKVTDETSDIFRILDARLKSLREQIDMSNVSPLTPSDIKSIRGTVSWYMGTGYKYINGFLRGSKNADDETKSVEDMDALIDNMPRTTKDMVVYRGSHKVDAEDFSGEFWGDEAYVSTSTSRKTGESFADGATFPLDGEATGPDNVLMEILVPKGSKGFYGDSIIKSKPSQDTETEFILPRGTQFLITDRAVDADGRIIIKAVAVTHGSELAERLPEFGEIIQQIRGGNTKALKQRIEQYEISSAIMRKRIEGKDEAIAGLEEAQRAYDEILAAQEDIDFYVESLMRDALEAGETPTGARVFIPTKDSIRAPKKTPIVKQAIGGRTAPRDLLDVYTGQFALLGDIKDLEQFSGALARNLRIPFIAYESVTRLTDYLMRTGTTIRFSDDPREFARQEAQLREAGLINGNGVLGEDYTVIPVNEETGFLDPQNFKEFDRSKVEAIGTKGRNDAGIDDAQTAMIIRDALDANASSNLGAMRGRTVVVISKTRFETLRKEMEAASQEPGLLRRLTRLWVRITLTTLPRTPIANVVGSGMLSALGGGLGGYREGLRLMRTSNAPPELLNKGLAGMMDEGGELVVPGQNQRFKYAQRYMNYLYYYNVMGEDLARLSVFTQTAKRGIKKSDALKQIDDEMLQAQELNDAFQLLLEAVARGEFANGKPLTPELIKIRNDALQKADDFLGGARGLTSQQRAITTFVPFWTWYKHIFKLYFYTLPFKYPGRSLTLNAMARYGAEESARQGYYDSFWEDAIKIGEEVRGPNLYSKALTTNIFPFTFGGVLEAQEGAPGASFIASNVAPVITTPLRIAGFGIPGQPLVTAEGERLDADFFSAETGETALSELERLIAPVGLLQRYLTPRSSLLLGAGRLATGNEIPQAQPQGEGLAYAVTPKGFAGLGAQALPEMALRAFGGTIERIPVEGPVARRRLRQREEDERQSVLDKYKERRQAERDRG